MTPTRALNVLRTSEPCASSASLATWARVSNLSVLLMLEVAVRVSSDVLLAARHHDVSVDSLFG